MTIDDIKTLCVTGAGQMGSQIAMQAALHGFDVRLHDIAEESLTKAMAGNRHQLERRVAKGKLDAEQVAAALARIETTTDLAAAASGVDFALEAVIERLDDKKRVFRALDAAAPPHAILATNSSYIGCSELAGETSRPEKVVNMHFFFPPLVMRLVEVVRGAATSNDTVETTAGLARRIGKEPVILNKELPGFLVNRILRAITNEAYFLLENGVASFEDIDKACEMGLNHPLGPFRLGDLSGLDIGYHARMKLYEETGDESLKPAASLARRFERGDLGRKTGRGFYDYSTKPPTPTED